MNLSPNRTKLQGLINLKNEQLSLKSMRPQSPSQCLTNFITRSSERKLNLHKTIVQKILEKGSLIGPPPRKIKQIEKLTFRKADSEKLLPKNFKETLQSDEYNTPRKSIRAFHHLMQTSPNKITQTRENDDMEKVFEEYSGILETDPLESNRNLNYSKEIYRSGETSVVKLPILAGILPGRHDSALKKVSKNAESSGEEKVAKTRGSPSLAIRLNRRIVSHSPARNRLAILSPNKNLNNSLANFVEISLEATESMNKTVSMNKLIQSQRLANSNIQIDSVTENHPRTHKHSTTWTKQALFDPGESSQPLTNRPKRKDYGNFTGNIENLTMTADVHRSKEKTSKLKYVQQLDQKEPSPHKNRSLAFTIDDQSPMRSEFIHRRIMLPRKTIPPKKIYPDPEHDTDEIRSIRMRSDHTKIMNRPTPLYMTDISQVTMNGARKSNWRILREKLMYALWKLKELNLNPATTIMKREVFSIRPFARAESRDFLRAARYGYLDEVQKLLYREKYLVYEFDDIHMTALHWAAKRGHTEIVKLLIKYHSDVDARDIIGRTAFYYAAESQQIEALKLLLIAGCDPWSTFDYNLREFLEKDQQMSYYVRKFNLTSKMLSKFKRKAFWEEMSAILMEKPSKS